MKNGMIAKILIGVFTLCIISGAAICVYNNNAGRLAAEKAKIEQARKGESQEVMNQNRPLGHEQLQQYKDVINLMHKMANNLVEADDHWGYEDMSMKNINKAYVELNKLPDTDIRQGLFDILDKWSNLDFKTIDKDHNYVWILLNGTVGEATGILDDKVQETIANMKAENK